MNKQVDPETAAMQQVAASFANLPKEVQERIADWAMKRYGSSVAAIEAGERVSVLRVSDAGPNANRAAGSGPAAESLHGRNARERVDSGAAGAMGICGRRSCFGAGGVAA